MKRYLVSLTVFLMLFNPAWGKTTSNNSNRLESGINSLLKVKTIDTNKTHSDTTCESLNENPETLESLIQRAESGDSEAQYDLVSKYSTGNGIEIDEEKARYWFNRYRNNIDSTSSNRLENEIRHLEIGSLKERKLADCFVSKAEKYLEGVEAPQNYLEAKKWFLKAANKPYYSTYAQFKLGWMNIHGYSAPKNYSNAVYWFTKAANFLDSKAQYNLGILYYQGGFGINKNYISSYKWFNIAQANGESQAAFMLADLETKMTAAQINEAQRLASSWQPKSND